MVLSKGNEKVMDAGVKLKRRRLICSDSEEEDNELLMPRFRRKKELENFCPHPYRPKVNGMGAKEPERMRGECCKPAPVVGTHAKECNENKKSIDSSASFWDKEDFGLIWAKSQSLISPYGLSNMESKDDRTVLGCIANDCVRALGLTAFFEGRLQKYKDSLSHVEKEVKRLAEENASLKESLQKGKDEQKRLRQELDTERSSGTSFLQSEAGRQHRVSLEMRAVHDFMESAEFKSVVKEWAATRMGSAL